MNEYLKFWKIKGPVFGVPSDPNDYFISESVNKILQRIFLFCDRSGSVTVLTALQGCGKSTLAHYIYSSLSPLTYEALILSLIKKESSPGWLMPRLADYFGIRIREYETSDQLTSATIRQLDDLVEEKRKLVIIIDNMEKISSPSALEEIDALLEIQMLTNACISFVLIGNEEMGNVITNSGINEKIQFKAVVSKLSLEEANDYIMNQLNRSSLKLGTVNSYGVKELYNLSNGVFSKLNAIAENSLMEAYTQNKRTIGSEIVKEAAKFVINLEANKTENIIPPTPEKPKAHVTKETIAPPKAPTPPVAKKTGTEQTPPAPPTRNEEKNEKAKDKPKPKTAAEQKGESDAKEDKNRRSFKDMKDIKLHQLFKKGEAS